MRTGDPEAWIDDFEDGDDRLLLNGGRTGQWIMTPDGTPTGVENEETRGEALSILHGDSSKQGMHIWGSGFSDWGTALLVWFLDKEPLKSYDAHRFKGITFLARIQAGTTPDLRFNIPSHGTEDEDGCLDCHDRYGVSLVLTTTWTTYNIDFSNCQQAGWGDPVAFDTSQLYGLEFSTPANARFDIWLDDVRFY